VLDAAEMLAAADPARAIAADVEDVLKSGVPLQPEAQALHALWDAKRHARAMPARSDFAFEDLRRWLGNLVLVDVLDRGADFLFRVYGTTVAHFFGHDLTGRRLSQLAAMPQRICREEYGDVVTSRRPRYVVRRPSIRRVYANAARVILPLSRDGRGVEQLLVGFYPIDATH
jgi:hypothetical protein